MRSSAHIYYYLLALGVFMILCGPALFSDGMFMDGLFYAAVANNMAEGIGTFWKPYLAEFYYKEFFEHPPLALGLQSIGFRIFGDSIYVERFYALLTYLLTGLLISLIWKEITGSIKSGWLAILFWILVAIVPWACANNMLENTMTVFVCLSFLSYIRFWKSSRWILLCLSAFSLTLALLTKGLVCLYIWALPFFLWLIYRKKSFAEMSVHTIALVLSPLFPLALLYLFSEPAANSMSRYIGDQLLTSLEKIVTVSSRFHIVWEFIQNILLPLGLAAITLGIYYHKKKSFSIGYSDSKMSIVFFLVCLAGVLPIMISLKQRGFYILTVYPFFALGLALIFRKHIDYLTSLVPVSYIRLCSLSLTLIALILCSFQFNRVGRDSARIADVKDVQAIVAQNKILSIHPDMYPDWSLHGYFARYGQISLDTTSRARKYKLLYRNQSLHSDEYKENSLRLREFTLYERRN